ncbi:MAG: hypothetical protein LUE14_01925 [Clostridiales bacterium]|nr:hypothetical protein [Clostridiales bacterium]
MYAERAGYIAVEMQKMDAGNENAYSWTVENGLHKLFSGDFGYTGPQTDDPQYYLYEYDPVGYSYYNLDGTSVTEEEYLEAHSEAYS